MNHIRRHLRKQQRSLWRAIGISYGKEKVETIDNKEQLQNKLNELDNK